MSCNRDRDIQDLKKYSDQNIYVDYYMDKDVVYYSFYIVSDDEYHSILSISDLIASVFNFKSHDIFTRFIDIGGDFSAVETGYHLNKLVKENDQLPNMYFSTWFIGKAL